MTDKWMERLSDYLDDEMSPAERALMEERLGEDEELASTLEGLRRVKLRAQTVEDAPPPHAHEMWEGIARRIGAASSERGAASPVRRIGAWRARRVRVSVPQLMAAGIALVLLSSGGAMLVQHWSSRDGGGGSPRVATSVTPRADASFVSIGATRYDQAVADLVRVLDEQRELLDPETVAVIEQNLAIIDRAIERSLAALRTDPESDYLRSHLEQTMRQKLTLLQHATAIPSSL
jgi:anti-sigma factor RsiW